MSIVEQVKPQSPTPCAGSVLTPQHTDGSTGLVGIRRLGKRGEGGEGGRQSKPSALSRTLSRALNMTVTTVIAGQVKPIRTTVEQPYVLDLVSMRTG